MIQNNNYNKNNMKKYNKMIKYNNTVNKIQKTNIY